MSFKQVKKYRRSSRTINSYFLFYYLLIKHGPNLIQLQPRLTSYNFFFLYFSHTHFCRKQFQISKFSLSKIDFVGPEVAKCSILQKFHKNCTSLLPNSAFRSQLPRGAICNLIRIQSAFESLSKSNTSTKLYNFSAD